MRRRTEQEGEAGILEDLGWLGVGWDEGPVRQSEQGDRYAEAAAQALGSGAVRDDDGSIRLDGITSSGPTAPPPTSWRASSTTSRSGSRT